MANAAIAHQFHQHGKNTEDQFLSVMDIAAHQWNTNMDVPHLHNQLGQIQASNWETVHWAW